MPAFLYDSEGNVNKAARLLPESYLQQMQTRALWRDLKVHKGTSLNQVKPVRVLDTPMKKKFFYGLREE